VKRLDVFSSIGLLSTGKFQDENLLNKISPEFLSNSAATNEKLHLLFLSCGTEDPRMPSYVVAQDNLIGLQSEFAGCFRGAYEREFVGVKLLPIVAPFKLKEITFDRKKRFYSCLNVLSF